jgi:hypothetical protein
MAFVNVPKDLSKVKTKIALNLTKRQLICFSAAAALGVPAYILTRGVLGNSGSALLMIGVMLPLFFVAMYEKDGQPAEIILRNYICCKFYRCGKRPYKTENLYEIIAKGGKHIASENKKTAGALVGKRKAGKAKPRRR